jgi:hypothetical protein
MISVSAETCDDENKSAKNENNPAAEATVGCKNDKDNSNTNVKANMFTRILPDPVLFFDTIFRPRQEKGSCFLLLISEKFNF